MNQQSSNAILEALWYYLLAAIPESYSVVAYLESHESESLSTDRFRVKLHKDLEGTAASRGEHF